MRLLCNDAKTVQAEREASPDPDPNPLTEQLEEQHAETLGILQDILGELWTFCGPFGWVSQREIHEEPRTATDDEASRMAVQGGLSEFFVDLRKNAGVQILKYVRIHLKQVQTVVNRIEAAIQRGTIPADRATLDRLSEQWPAQTATKPIALCNVIDGKGATIIKHVRLESARRCAKTWNETKRSTGKPATIRKAWLAIPLKAKSSSPRTRSRKVVK